MSFSSELGHFLYNAGLIPLREKEPIGSSDVRSNLGFLGPESCAMPLHQTGAADRRRRQDGQLLYAEFHHRKT